MLGERLPYQKSVGRLVEMNQKFRRVIIGRLKAHSEALDDIWILSMLDKSLVGHK